MSAYGIRVRNQLVRERFRLLNEFRGFLYERFPDTFTDECYYSRVKTLYLS